MYPPSIRPILLYQSEVCLPDSVFVQLRTSTQYIWVLSGSPQLLVLKLCLGILQSFLPLLLIFRFCGRRQLVPRGVKGW